MGGSSSSNQAAVPGVRVCVVGSNVTDMISYVDRIPNIGETLLGTKFETGFGGKGANQAVMAANLGADVKFVGKVGTDSFGDGTIKNFKEKGVAWMGYTTDKAASGVAPIWVDNKGQNAIIVIGGANDHFTADEVREQADAITSSKVLLCQNEIPLATTQAALEIARKAGVTTVLNTAPAPSHASDLDPLLPFVDILCPNEPELQTLTGKETATDEQVVEAARSLMTKGVKVVLVTIGERGAMIVTSDNVITKPCAKVEVKDTVGAGDCFLGSFAYFYAEEANLSSAVEKACIVASLSVTKPGTQASFPTRETALKFVAEQMAER